MQLRIRLFDPESIFSDRVNLSQVSISVVSHANIVNFIFPTYLSFQASAHPEQKTPDSQSLEPSASESLRSCPEYRPDRCLNVCRSVRPHFQCIAEDILFEAFELWKYEVEVIRKVKVVEDCFKCRKSGFGTVVRVDDEAVQDPFLRPVELVGWQLNERFVGFRG